MYKKHTPKMSKRAAGAIMQQEKITTIPADERHHVHYQLDEGLDDTLQVCRATLTVEKETAIVEMSQKTRLARFIFLLYGGNSRSTVRP
jgi:hypothetical protein